MGRALLRKSHISEERAAKPALVATAHRRQFSLRRFTGFKDARTLCTMLRTQTPQTYTSHIFSCKKTHCGVGRLTVWQTLVSFFHLLLMLLGRYPQRRSSHDACNGHQAAHRAV